MIRSLYLVLGLAALVVGMIGIAVPGLPTVPFLILAAFLFARADPRLERWLVEHRRFGPPIRAWRERGAIGVRAKIVALVMLAASSASAWLLLPFPWSLFPIAACLAAGLFISTRPNA